MMPDYVAKEIQSENEIQELEAMVDLLSLVEINVTVAEVNAWTAEQFTQAENYACSTYAIASDNPGTYPRLPGFLEDFVK